MFENIIGQAEVVQTLRGELAHGSFPRASLFSGPAYAGKLSTALETARVLTCAAGNAPWSCDCAACRMQKELSHPHTVLLGSRYCDVEMASCADALARTRKNATLYLYIRAVRKLTRRFDASITDTDDPRMKGVPDKVSKVEELLGQIVPGRELPDEKALADLLDKIAAAATPLAAQVRGDTIGIDQVRRLGAWAHLTASGSRKVAVIENADRMQDSARNALLKLLEEPPEAVSIILLSTRRAAIIPTILSRLRPYTFAERPAAEDREVMEKIFRQEKASHNSLREFFLAWKEINPEKLATLSTRFLDLVAGPPDADADVIAEMTELFPERKAQRDRSQKETMISFLEELTRRFHDTLRAGRADPDLLSAWSARVREALMRLETYNMSPAEVLESLFFAMRDEARDEASAGAASP